MVRAESFNQPLDHFDVSNCQRKGKMLHLASAFNQPLPSWSADILDAIK
jgi:hypothetical protein